MRYSCRKTFWWFEDVLKLEKNNFSKNNEDIFSLSPNRHTQVPYHPWLVEIDRELNKRITFKRTLASREKHISILRPGMKFLDLMERYSKWDDKGTTFITHRKIKGWVGEEYIAFKVSVICQPGIAQDNLLSPTIEDLALEGEFNVIFQPMKRVLS